MTWHERRIVTLLGGFLALLAAVLLIVLGIRYRANRDVPAEDSSVPASADAAGTEEPQQAASPYTALTYFNGTATLSFSIHASGAWIWSDDADFPLDTSTVSAILAHLTSWAPKETVTDAGTIAASGVTEPVATLTAATPEGDVHIAFGGPAEEDGRYVALNGDADTVYIIDDALYRLLCVPIYDMCVLPRLPALPEDVIQSIVIQGAQGEGGGVSTTLTAQKEGRGNISWRSGGADVTGDPTVRALLEDLAALSFAKCVIYRPSEEAASFCGFDAPAKLTVFYTSDGEEDAALELWVGNRLSDESGRYVRLGTEDPSIYLLLTEALDPLMRISVSGLE